MEEYDRLSKIVPSNVSSMEERTNHELSKTIEEILEKQREISLFNLYKDNLYPPYFPDDHKEFYNFIHQPKSLLTPPHASFITKMYEHYLNNPNELVSLAITASSVFDPNGFAFFCYSTIPSIFGYFSSYEHVAFGYHFYCNLMSKAKHHVFTEIVTPFFRNATTFRYIESVATEVVSFLCQDLRLLRSEHVQQVLAEDVDVFMESLKRNIPLLPKAHINIFLLMRNAKKKYGGAEILNFFITHFVQPMVTGFLLSSPYSAHVKLFGALCEAFLAKEGPKAADALFAGIAAVDVPSMFGDFGERSLSVLATPLDASMLATLAHSANAVPPLLLALEKQCQEDPATRAEQHLYTPTSINIFPRKDLHRVAGVGGSLFISSNSQKSEKCQKIEKCQNDKFGRRLLAMRQKYERPVVEIAKRGEDPHFTERGLIGDKEVSFSEFAIEEETARLLDALADVDAVVERRALLEILRTFGGAVAAHHERLVFFHGERLIDQHLAELGTADAAQEKNYKFLESFPLLNTRANRQQFLAARAEYLMDVAVTASIKEELAELERRFPAIADGFDAPLPPQFSRGGSDEKRLRANKEFVGVVGALSTVIATPFTKRFFHLELCLRALSRLSAGVGAPSVIAPALRICHAPGVVASLTKVAGLLVKRKDFAALLTREEAELWTELEAALLAILAMDEEALHVYTRVVDHLILAL